MSVISELSEIFGSAFESVGADRSHALVTYSQRPDLCQFQCNGAMPAAKSAGMNPRELAEKVVEAINQNPEYNTVISDLSIAGPGFLNIDIEPSFIAEILSATAASANFGLNENQDAKKKVLLDFGGPNVAKSLHVGHLRTAIIGESLMRTYAFAGVEATSDVHLGDWGLPMGQLIAAIEDSSPDLPYFDPEFSGEYPKESPVTIQDLEVLYPEASARCKVDEAFAQQAQLATKQLQDGHPGYRALWQHFRDVSVAELKKNYGALGVDFDLWLGEASVNDRLPAMLERIEKTGVSKTSDGAVIVEVVAEEDTAEIPPLMLLNSRGGLTYAATDVATIEERVDDLGIDKIVYIVDNRQSLHFEQVFRTSRLAQIAGEEIELIHAPNGTVNGPDGKPLKTRDGNLPRLEDLISDAKDLALKQLDENSLATEYDQQERNDIAHQVGLAALTYGELQNHRTTNYNFDLERFTQLKGQTGPYLQYVAVRTASNLRKAEEQGLTPGEFAPWVDDSEANLALNILRLPEIIDRTLEQSAPSQLAEYVYELASSFNTFYDCCHIVSQTDPRIQQSWLALVKLTNQVLTKLCHLLLVPVPDRM